MNALAILDVEDTEAAQLTMPSSPFLMLCVVSVISGGRSSLTSSNNAVAAGASSER
jgi:hypothetical protein